MVFQWWWRRERSFSIQQWNETRCSSLVTSLKVGSKKHARKRMKINQQLSQLINRRGFQLGSQNTHISPEKLSYWSPSEAISWTTVTTQFNRHAAVTFSSVFDSALSNDKNSFALLLVSDKHKIIGPSRSPLLNRVSIFCCKFSRTDFSIRAPWQTK